MTDEQANDLIVRNLRAERTYLVRRLELMRSASQVCIRYLSPSSTEPNTNIWRDGTITEPTPELIAALTQRTEFFIADIDRRLAELGAMPLEGGA